MRTVGKATYNKTTDGGFSNMSLAVLTGILVDKTVDTGGAESGSCNALTLRASPGTWGLAATEGFNGASHYGSFGGLLPFLVLLRLPTSASASFT
jgi:hypothetical protein